MFTSPLTASGSFVGSTVGSTVGSVVGSVVGSTVGSTVGSVVGSTVGAVVGFAEAPALFTYAPVILTFERSTSLPAASPAHHT